MTLDQFIGTHQTMQREEAEKILDMDDRDGPTIHVYDGQFSIEEPRPGHYCLVLFGWSHESTDLHELEQMLYKELKDLDCFIDAAYPTVNKNL